jgi:hypothetical protein
VVAAAALLMRHKPAMVAMAAFPVEEVAVAERQ